MKTCTSCAHLFEKVWELTKAWIIYDLIIGKFQKDDVRSQSKFVLWFGIRPRQEKQRNSQESWGIRNADVQRMRPNRRSSFGDREKGSRRRRGGGRETSESFDRGHHRHKHTGRSEERPYLETCPRLTDSGSKTGPEVSKLVAHVKYRITQGKSRSLCNGFTDMTLEGSAVQVQDDLESTLANAGQRALALPADVEKYPSEWRNWTTIVPCVGNC